MSPADSIKDYGMFTDAGNHAVHTVVRRAQMLNMSWPHVLPALDELSQRPDFAEATDTVVREMVFESLGFVDQNLSFYS